MDVVWFGLIVMDFVFSFVDYFINLFGVDLIDLVASPPRTPSPATARESQAVASEQFPPAFT